MTSRRDIELLISARDQTGRTFPTLVKNVADLSAKLGEQALAAEKGEVKLSELERTQRALAEAARELVQQQTLVDAFKRQAQALSDAEKKAQQLAAEYAALKNELAGAETVSAAQERRLASLEKQTNAAAAAFDRAKANFAETSAAMEKAGLSVNNLDRQQDQLVQSAKEVGTSLSAVSGLIDGYEDHVRQLATAERSAQQTHIGEQRAAEALKLKQAAEYTRFWTQALDEAQAAEQRLAGLTSFRQVGQDALEASRDMTRFVESGQTMQIATNDLAQGLRAIVEPGREASRTLQGVEQQVAEAARVAGTEKLRVSEYSDALNRLSQASADLVRQGSLIDTFRQQADAVELARAKFQQAQAEVQQYATKVATADEPNDQLAASLRRAETALDAAGRALVNEETKLGQLSRGLKQAGIDVNNLDAAQDRLVASANQAAAASSKMNNALGRNGGRPGGLFGLNPYELQNLTFQINDVVTGLISGQRPLQVLLQQGGQITQIFPGAISAIAKFALAWAPVIAAVGAVIAILAELDDDIDRVKEFSNALNANIDGGAYDPKKLAEIAEGLEIIGVEAEVASEAVKAFVDAGADPDQIEELATTAAEMAEVLGIEVPEATELLTNALSGGYDSVVELDEVTRTLTAAELEHVQALFDSGNAAEARQFVFDRVGQKMDDLARANRSVWQVAANNFRSAWNNLLGKLGETGIVREAKAEIDNLSAGVAVLAALLNGKSLQQAREDAWAAIRAGQGESSIRRRLREQEQASQRQQKIDGDYIQNLEEQDKLTQELTRSERLRLIGIKALREAQKAGVSDEAARRAQEIAIAAETRKLDEKEAKEAERAAKRGAAAARKEEAAAKRAANAAKAEANRIKGIQNQLTQQLRQLAQRAGRGENATLEQRLEAVNIQYEKIFDTLTKLKNAGITTDATGMPLSEVVEIVEAQKEQVKQEERLAYWEDQLKALVGQRKALIEGVADEQERGIKSTTDAFREVQDINSRLAPGILAAAKNALALAKAIGGAKPNPELVAFIDEMERLIQREEQPNILQTPQADIGNEGLNQREQRLNEIIRERNALVESYNNLVELGIISRAEADELSRQAYDRARPEIESQLTAIQRIIDLLREQGIITQTVYDTWIAKIRAVNAESEYTDDLMGRIKKTAEQSIANGLTNAFHTAAEAIAGLITGTMDWGDALSAVLRSGLQLLADLAKAIADAIIQMLALAAAKAIVKAVSGGVLHGGGIVGSGGGRRQRKLPALAYLGAPRLHGGGGLGLKSDEYTAILQRGEEVVTEEDPRHISNIGRGGPGEGPSGIRQVLAIGDEEIANAMNGAAGERTVVTHIRRNKATIKQILEN